MLMGCLLLQTLLLWFGFYGFNPGTMGYLVLADGSAYAEVQTCFFTPSTHIIQSYQHAHWHAIPWNAHLHLVVHQHIAHV